MRYSANRQTVLIAMVNDKVLNKYVYIIIILMAFRGWNGSKLYLNQHDVNEGVPGNLSPL